MHPSELHAVDADKRFRSYSRGDVVFADGGDALGVHCINAGSVKVFRCGRDGKDQILRFAGPGDILGYRALLGGGVHTNTATALGSAQICYVPRSAFLALLSRSPTLNTQMFGLLTRELRTAEAHMVDIAQRPVRERVAETLLVLKQRFGVDRDGMTLQVRLTRGDIADAVGAATESVIRSLADMKSDGIIEINGRSIAIRDSERLVAASGVLD